MDTHYHRLGRLNHTSFMVWVSEAATDGQERQALSTYLSISTEEDMSGDEARPGTSHTLFYYNITYIL